VLDSIVNGSVGGRLVYFWPEGVDGECTVKRGHRAVGRRVDIVLPDEPQVSHLFLIVRIDRYDV
jgi:hypothetical protein